MRSFMAAALVIALAACGGEELDVTGLPTTDGYTSWARFDYKGPLPGHGESWRIVYVNDVGTSFGGGGRYAPGTVIVKEIHGLGDGQTPGPLKYVAIMRKLGKDAESPAELDDGWLFSLGDNRSERHGPTCWGSCHQAAPLDGTFADYGRVAE